MNVQYCQISRQKIRSQQFFQQYGSFAFSFCAHGLRDLFFPNKRLVRRCPFVCIFIQHLDTDFHLTAQIVMIRPKAFAFPCLQPLFFLSAAEIQIRCHPPEHLRRRQPPSVLHLIQCGSIDLQFFRQAIDCQFSFVQTFPEQTMKI